MAAVAVLLVRNYFTQTREDQMIALVGLAIGVVFAALQRLPHAALPEYRLPAA